ncbi:MAG: hypothetical protein RHS_4134 [Robinsoniella sp. RHS]|nr:MAG: hypothetical protein RHS_4134 [Robinsoniella sp. RHS]
MLQKIQKKSSEGSVYGDNFFGYKPERNETADSDPGFSIE